MSCYGGLCGAGGSHERSTERRGPCAGTLGLNLCAAQRLRDVLEPPKPRLGCILSLMALWWPLVGGRGSVYPKGNAEACLLDGHVHRLLYSLSLCQPVTSGRVPIHSASGRLALAGGLTRLYLIASINYRVKEVHMKASDVLSMKRAAAMARYLIGAGKHRDASLVALCAGFGLRVGDAIGMTWGEVTDGASLRDLVVVREKKNRSQRTATVLPWVKEILGAYRDQLGTPAAQDAIIGYSRQRAWQVIREASDALGYGGRVSPHSLRKAFCTAVFEQTHDPVLTARITGHTNPAQLLAYIGRRPEVEDMVWDRLAKLKV